MTITLDQCTAVGCGGEGFAFGAGVRANVSRCSAIGNGGAGFSADLGADVALYDCYSGGNGGAGAEVRARSDAYQAVQYHHFAGALPPDLISRIRSAFGVCDEVSPSVLTASVLAVLSVGEDEQAEALFRVRRILPLLRSADDLRRSIQAFRNI